MSVKERLLCGHKPPASLLSLPETSSHAKRVKAAAELSLWSVAEQGLGLRACTHPGSGLLSDIGADLRAYSRETETCITTDREISVDILVGVKSSV